MEQVSYKPYVVEDEDTKILYFSSFHVQSEMCKHVPFNLALGYTQAMMAFLLLKPNFSNILIVGLGGGSLSKYCYQQFPQATITTVEINADVIALRDTFLIPKDDERFRIIHADAADYLRNADSVADIILLDGYDDYGIPDALATVEFYQNCKNALCENGILVGNFNCSDIELDNYVERVSDVFDGKVLEADAATSYNQIIFALKNLQPLDLHAMQKEAAQLKQALSIDFPRFLNQMWASARQRSKWQPMLVLSK